MNGTGRTVRTLVPARIDRLNWSPFHTRMVIALITLTFQYDEEAMGGAALRDSRAGGAGEGR